MPACACAPCAHYRERGRDVLPVGCEIPGGRAIDGAAVAILAGMTRPTLARIGADGAHRLARRVESLDPRAAKVMPNALDGSRARVR